MDVKSIILKGDLKEELYIEQPQGFIFPINEHKVCNLVKLLMG